MKNTFIIAMFVFWGFVIAVVSAGYISKQNRVAQVAVQKAYDQSIKKLEDIASSTNTTVITTADTSTTGSVKPTPTPKPTTPTSVPTPTKPTLTLATVATHNVSSDCWLVISGKVYSMSAYIPMHPGGAKRIINVCGTDATSEYGPQGGHRHSGFADSLLGQYLVGNLQ